MATKGPFEGSAKLTKSRGKGLEKIESLQDTSLRGLKCPVVDKDPTPASDAGVEIFVHE
jgi:hypothetical protein